MCVCVCAACRYVSHLCNIPQFESSLTSALSSLFSREPLYIKVPPSHIISYGTLGERGLIYSFQTCPFLATCQLSCPFSLRLPSRCSVVKPGGRCPPRLSLGRGGVLIACSNLDICNQVKVPLASFCERESKETASCVLLVFLRDCSIVNRISWRKIALWFSALLERKVAMLAHELKSSTPLNSCSLSSFPLYLWP